MPNIGSTVAHRGSAESAWPNNAPHRQDGGVTQDLIPAGLERFAPTEVLHTGVLVCRRIIEDPFMKDGGVSLLENGGCTPRAIGHIRQLVDQFERLVRDNRSSIDGLQEALARRAAAAQAESKVTPSDVVPETRLERAASLAQRVFGMMRSVRAPSDPAVIECIAAPPLEPIPQPFLDLAWAARDAVIRLDRGHFDHVRRFLECLGTVAEDKRLGPDIAAVLGRQAAARDQFNEADTPVLHRCAVAEIAEAAAALEPIVRAFATSKTAKEILLCIPVGSSPEIFETRLAALPRDDKELRTCLEFLKHSDTEGRQRFFSGDYGAVLNLYASLGPHRSRARTGLLDFVGTADSDTISKLEKVCVTPRGQLALATLIGGCPRCREHFGVAALVPLVQSGAEPEIVLGRLETLLCDNAPTRARLLLTLALSGTLLGRPMLDYLQNVLSEDRAEAILAEDNPSREFYAAYRDATASAAHRAAPAPSHPAKKSSGPVSRFGLDPELSQRVGSLSAMWQQRLRDLSQSKERELRGITAAVAEIVIVHGRNRWMLTIGQHHQCWNRFLDHVRAGTSTPEALFRVADDHLQSRGGALVPTLLAVLGAEAPAVTATAASLPSNETGSHWSDKFPEPVRVIVNALRGRSTPVGRLFVIGGEFRRGEVEDLIQQAGSFEGNSFRVVFSHDGVNGRRLDMTGLDPKHDVLVVLTRGIGHGVSTPLGEECRRRRLPLYNLPTRGTTRVSELIDAIGLLNNEIASVL